MSDHDDGDLEVHNFHGNEGEQVPKPIVELIVEEGVQVLPNDLCSHCLLLREVSLPNGLLMIGNRAFHWCLMLLKVKIASTVKFIGGEAFAKCELLAKVEFEDSTSSQLQTIDRRAFSSCASLQKMKPPSSVTRIGQYAFEKCTSLVEANLSTTGLTSILPSTFGSCTSLQTVSLPNKVGWIRFYAFDGCPELVTVVVPLDSKPIRIGRGCFRGCKRLANLVLPKDSTAEEDSFDGCDLLQERYGDESSRIVASLMRRFGNLAVHRLCYDNAGITPQKLQKCIEEQEEKSLTKDDFGMTVFHLLCSTVEPRVELFEVLLNQYSAYETVNWKDANNKRPLDYLVNNWSDATAALLEPTLQKWMIDPLVHWGALLWVEGVKTKVREVLLSEHDKKQRVTLINELYSTFERYEKIEKTSILELALWKGKLKSGWSSDGSKRQALDRVECRCLCGSDVVIPSVTGFLFV